MRKPNTQINCFNSTSMTCTFPTFRQVCTWNHMLSSKQSESVFLKKWSPPKRARRTLFHCTDNFESNVTMLQVCCQNPLSQEQAWMDIQGWFFFLWCLFAPALHIWATSFGLKLLFKLWWQMSWVIVYLVVFPFNSKKTLCCFKLSHYKC